MKDHLLDLIEHTHKLGCVDLVKITGDDKSTAIFGVAGDRTVVVTGKYANPVPEFMGVFGMPNLSKLSILLNLPEYQEGADLSITSDDAGKPDGIVFQNTTKDFKNTYRFMLAEHVEQKAKDVKFKGVPWHVVFEPSASAIMRLKMQAQANAEESNFQARTENGNLKFSFGDHSTHSGTFVFQSDVEGTLKRSWSWPVKTVVSILDSVGDKVMSISDDGACQITVDSGIAVYTYIIPAQSK
jgi:hypothetical protein